MLDEEKQEDSSISRSLESGMKAAIGAPGNPIASTGDSAPSDDTSILRNGQLVMEANGKDLISRVCGKQDVTPEKVNYSLIYKSLYGRVQNEE